MTQATATHEVWYLRIWGTFHLVVGSVFSLVFIVGAAFVEDYSFLLYLLFSGLLIYMGLVRLRKPYLVYSANQIRVRGTYGENYKIYTWNKPEEIEVKNGRVFLNGNKLRFNSWFTNRHQYNRMLAFFNGKFVLENELH